MARTQWVAVAAAAALLGLSGCRRESRVNETMGTTIDTHSEQEYEKQVPSEYVQTSAAYPTGWADQAERRQNEIDFSMRMDQAPILPPSAIGGGPTF